MAVYYKFKSAKDYESISIVGHFITVAYLKEKIYECKHLGSGTDYDLVVTNAQTNEEYVDEDMLIPKNTSVLLRRIPGLPRMPLVAAPVTKQAELNGVNELDAGAGLSVTNYLDGSEYDDFGSDLYEIPEVVPFMSNNQPHDTSAPSKADEDNKIQALIDTPALDWQQQNLDGFDAGRGFGRATGGQIGARCFGRGGGFERKTPPPGYVCHRCKTPGHFIQHCPTNGDPNFDIKRVKPPTGIPKSMLIATPDGSYALPNGAVAVLKPNEAAFEKEIEGMTSTCTVGDLPPELHCPLCKQAMKDAVFTSKCCFNSFCDKCIRDHVINKSACVCGATNVLADDLLPNTTVRDTINRLLELNNSSTENGSSAYHVQDMESAKFAPPPQPKIPSPAPSATAKGEQPPPHDEDITKMQPGSTEHDATPIIQQTVSGKGKVNDASDVSEAAYESKSLMKTALQERGRLVDDEVQQKQVTTAAVKKKKKRVNTPICAAEMQWMASQEYAPENYMMPPGPNPYNPYWNGIQPGMDAFTRPYGGGMPYMGGYAFGVPGGLMMSPFIPPQRDLVMSRDEFEVRRGELKRKRGFDNDKHSGTASRKLTTELEFSRQARGNEDGPALKSKTRQIPPPSSDGLRHRTGRPSPDHHHRSHRHMSHSGSESSPLESKRVAAAEATASSTTSDRKHKPLVFSRISFPEEEAAEAAAAAKKCKLTSSSSDAAAGGGSAAVVSWKSRTNYAAPADTIEHESSDDDRHFKRRCSRY